MRFFLYVQKHYIILTKLTNNINGNNSNNSHHIGNRECLCLLYGHSLHHEEHDKDAMRSGPERG